VLIRAGHEVSYDVSSPEVIRSVHVSGTLRFADDRDTRLDVGLIRIEAGDAVSEEGFHCAMSVAREGAEGPRPALLVGTPERPIPAGHSATIRLTAVEGLDPESFPAIVCCGGLMEFHGAPMPRTWTKLSKTAGPGEATVVVPAADVEGWRPGDRVIVTGTTRQFARNGQRRTTSVAERPSTEERLVTEIGRRHDDSGDLPIGLDRPLELEHQAEGDYRAELANLSRNVVVESAEPDGVRGHTMYHRHSAGSISYAEFRHLGKRGVLGRYSLHFHLLGDTMRGSSVIGASIWDSHNRWITVHGTDYLVVRDCVGYKSIGHGFFLEDGTETRNVFDRNLAVMALRGEPLPDQVLPFDGNLGSGFWWSNSLNSFTRNVAAECDQDGFRFEVFASERFDPVLPVLRPDGSRAEVDVRTLPFLRFEGNEAHCQRFFGLNLGGFSSGAVPGYPAPRELAIEDVDGVGPDGQHPFVIQDFRAWNTHWAFHAGSPSVLVEGMDIHDSEYGIWRCVTDRHEYRGLSLSGIGTAAVFFPRPGRAGKDDGLANLRPVDDLPPSTVITRVTELPSGGLQVRGVASDNRQVARVIVNGKDAGPIGDDISEWGVVLPGTGRERTPITAHAVDTSGNAELTGHEIARCPDSPIAPNQDPQR
jgi:hypothetical protein